MAVRVTHNNGLVWTADIDYSPFDRSAAHIEGRSGQMTGRVMSDGERMEQMFKRLAITAGAFFSIQKGEELISSIVKVRGEFQQLEIAFSTMLQSRERANVLMREVVDLAAKTPFGLTDAAQGAKQLLAYGSAAESVIDELRMIGDIASGVSVPLGDLVYLYGTLRTQGRAYAVDIRQFAGRGIPIYEELAKVMGVAKDQVAGLVEAGKVGFPQVEKAFKNMTSQGGMFFNLMEKQSASLTGQVERLKDSIEIMFNEIGQSGEGIFSGAIQSAAYLVEHYREIAKILGVMVATYGAYKVAVALVTATEAARTKTLGANAALLGQSVKDELLATQLIRDKAIALQQEAIAEATATKAKYQSLQAEVSSLAARRQSLTLAALEKRRIVEAAAGNLFLAQQELAALGTTATARQVEIAQRKVNIATKRLEVAQNQSSAASQIALATAQDFSTKKTQLQTTAVAINASMKKVATTTNAAMAASETAATVSSTRLTLAQHAQALSARLAAGAQALLNATMLSNPIVATVAIVGGLVAAYFALRDNTTAAERAQERLAKSLEDVGKKADDLKNKTSELVNVINDNTQPYQEQVLRFKELQALYPERLKNLTLEEYKLKSTADRQRELNAAASNYKAADIEKQYSGALSAIEKLRAKYQSIIVLETSDFALKRVISREIETQEALAERLRIEVDKQREAAKLAAMTESERLDYYKSQKAELEKQLTQHEAVFGHIIRTAKGTIEIKDNINAWSALTLINQLDHVIGQINSLNKILGASGKPIRTVNTIDEDIKKLKEERDANSANAKQYQEYTKKIKVLEKERAAITGEVDKKALSAAKKAESEREKLAKKQKELIEDLTDAERQATIDRMIEGEKQIAEYKARFDKMREALRDAKITDPKAFARIDAMEQAASNDYWYNQQTEHIKDHLSDQKKLYEEFEDYKKEYGIEAAKREFAGKIDVEKNYLQYVRRLYDDFEKTQDGKESTATTMGRRFVFEGGLAEGKTDEQDRIKQRVDLERQAYKQLLDEAGGFYYKSQQLAKQHKAQLKGLEDDRLNISADEYKRRFKIINDAYQSELKKLNIAESPIFKKLSLDATNQTLEELTTLVVEIDQILETGKMEDGIGKVVDVSPDSLNRLAQARNNLQGFIKDTIALRNETSKAGKVANIIQDVAKGLGEVSDSFSSIGDGRVGKVVGEIGKYLNDVVDIYERMSDLVDTINNATKAVGDAASSLSGVMDSKDVVGLVVQVVNLFSTIIGKAIGKQSVITKEMKREVADWNANLLDGEYKITAEMREQNRLQAEAIELTKLQIDTRKELYEKDKSELQKEQEQIMKELNSAKPGYQYQSYIKENGTIAYSNLVKLSQQEVIDYYKNKMSEKQLDAFKEILTSEYGNDDVFLGDIKKIISTNPMFMRQRGFALQVMEEQLTKMFQDGGGSDITFEDLERLYNKGQLEGATLTYFERWRDIRKEINELEKDNAENIRREMEAATGTTSDSIADSIIQGFKEGKRSVADFADTLEDALRGAMLNSLKYDYLEGPIQEFYKEFAAMGEGGYTESEFAALREKWKGIIEGTTIAAENLEKVTGTSLSDSSNKNKNSLAGAVSSASQESIDVLSGHTMGMRVAQLKTNEILTWGFSEGYEIANRSLDRLEKIAKNTYDTVQELKSLNNKIQSGSDLALAMGGL